MYEENSYDPLTEMFNDQELFSRTKPAIKWDYNRIIWRVLAALGSLSVWAFIATWLWKLHK